MSASRKAALLLGLGVLAAAPVAGWAEEARHHDEAPVTRAAGTDASPSNSAAPPAAAAAETQLKGAAAPDETIAFAPVTEYVLPESTLPESEAGVSADANLTPVPAALTAPDASAAEHPDLVVDEPAPPASAAVKDPSTTGSGADAPPLSDAAARQETSEARAAPVQAPAHELSAARTATEAGPAPAEAQPAPAKAEERPTPAASAPVDRIGPALAARLADDKQIHPRLAKRERDAIAAFYAIGNHQPVWIKDGAWTPAATQVIERLKAAPEDGLDAGEYPIPALGVTASESPADIAEAELKLAASAVLYARDARGGRLDPSRISSLITPKLELPNADAVLTALASAPDAGAALQAYNPPHPGYRALRAKLAELRASRPGAPIVRVPEGPVLKLGMRDPRVPLIRARFNLGPETGEDVAYDERVASAVASFQRQNGLRADGQLTRQTVAALGQRSPARLEADLLANMERWRWMPSDMGQRHVAVNIPEYRLRIWDGGAVVHQTRVIVGKPITPTPIFTGAMDHAVVNPSWFVPPSIINKEFKGANGEIAARAGYEVVRRGNVVTVRQPPGPRNALGNIKFMFPNQHAVYLHDTPNRGLFSAERRAFSHGCVRVDQPMALGAQLLGADGWTEARLRGLVGYGERTIKLGAQVPVHIGYFTLAVDETGELRSFEDLYGYNARVKRALGLQG